MVSYHINAVNYLHGVQLTGLFKMWSIYYKSESGIIGWESEPLGGQRFINANKGATSQEERVALLISNTIRM